MSDVTRGRRSTMVNQISGVGFPISPGLIPIRSRQGETVEGVIEVAPIGNQRAPQNDNQRPATMADKGKNAGSSEDLGLGSLGERVDSANQLMESLNRQINFVIDDRIDRVVVKIIDASTKEVIRQIPPEEMVVIMNRLQNLVDDLKGILYNHKG